MWKVFLTLITHRFLLLAVALFTINSRISPQVSGRTFRPIQPTSVLLRKFIDRIEEGQDAAALNAVLTQAPQNVFSLSRDPFIWIVRWVAVVIPVRPVYLLLVISNLFLLLFLWELTSLGSRMALPDIASSAAVLVVLWVTSYELSLGSSLSLSCFLVTMLLRHAIDNMWLFTGIGLGLLGIMDPIAVGLIPILVYLFWHFQRHFQVGEVVKRLVFFLVPIGLVVAWKWQHYAGIGAHIQSSALFNLINAVKVGNLSGWPTAQSNLGQTISLVLFLIGTLAAMIVNSSFIHRLLPAYIFTAVLAFSSYGALASRMLLAGICLQGITATASGILLRLIQLALIILSCYEMVSVF